MIDIVIPTIGRQSLGVLLDSIARARGPHPGRIIVVDDRRDCTAPLDLGSGDAVTRARVSVVRGSASGPAAARNIGYRESQATWIAFLDDDVVVADDWLEALDRDLHGLEPDVAGSVGRVRVPLPADRAPTDWERNVGGLETAQWITADCAYRRSALAAAGGFDERFERAFREDAELALRIIARGMRIVYGERRVSHPVRPAPWDISVRLQRGNADDVLMAALHGPDWYERAGAPIGAIADHGLTVASAGVAVLGFAAWLALTARFAWRRIVPGPRDAGEIAKMLATSIAIPFAAVYHRFLGFARRDALLGDVARAPRPIASAVLFDRDGTLIVDVPYNADPDAVVAMPRARIALDRLRRAGIPTAVVSNQSGVALGKFSASDVDAINARVSTLLGTLGPVFTCMHGPDDGCACRKPAPGLIEVAARALGVRPQDCVVIGDIASDMTAAHAAGARAILVANAQTLAAEIADAPHVAPDLDRAVRDVLAGAV